MFVTTDLEENSFPWLFPSAKGTCDNHVMPYKMCTQSRIYYKSLTFAKDQSYIFWLLNIHQLYVLKDAVRIALPKSNTADTISRAITLSRLKTSPDLLKSTWTMLKNIRGTDGY